MEFKINKTKYIFKITSPSSLEGDVLCIWTTPDVSSGDDVFVDIHNTAGGALYREAQKQLTVYGSKPKPQSPPLLPVGKTIVTFPGLLMFKRVVHCVCPNYRVEYQMKNKDSLLSTALDNIYNTCISLKENNIAFKSLCLTSIPEQIFGNISKEHYNSFAQSILRYSNKDSRFKVITVVFKDEEEYKQYVRVFVNLTQPWYKRIKYFFTNTI